MNSSSPYNQCAHPPLSRGNEPDPTTGADVAPAQEVGCYITGGTVLGATSAPAQVTMSLAASGATTVVTWSGSGYTWVNNQGTNTNVCGTNGTGGSGAAGSNGGTVTVSNLAAGLFFVNGNVTITGGSTDDGFLTIVAGNQGSAGPVEWSTIMGNTASNSSSVTGLSATSLIAKGDTVNDADGIIPNNATVSSINALTNTITMSQQATGTLSGDLLTFTSPNVSGNMTANSRIVTSVTTSSDVAVGDLIADNDGTIPPLTTVTAFTANTLTMSQPANANDSGDQMNLSSQNANASAGDIAIDGLVTYSGPVVTSTTACPSNWNPCPASDQSDVLGLVAQNFVELPEAIGSGSSCSNPYTIEAAMLALSDSVYVSPGFTQGWTQGNWQCYLKVFGSIAQNFRGPVGTVGSTGYIKQYVYDTSLLALWPPYFLSSQNATGPHDL